MQRSQLRALLNSSRGRRKERNPAKRARLGLSGIYKHKEGVEIKASVYVAFVSEISRSQSNGQFASNRKTKIARHLKDVNDILATSRELVKVMNRVSCAGEKSLVQTTPLLSALASELRKAQKHVENLVQEQRPNPDKANGIPANPFDAKAATKMKDNDRVRLAMKSVEDELVSEKKARRQVERLNKKLGRELANTKAMYLKVVKEAETERRSREILEQMCEELAEGIREDRDEFEALKRELARNREEVEREREMLQLADVLREERVQMKLTEAKYQFEEKHAAVDTLKNEVAKYLEAENRDETNDIEQLKAYLKKTLVGPCRKTERDTMEREAANGRYSVDSDLHSIELNMDNNRRSLEWTYTATPRDSLKRATVDDKFTGIDESGPRQKQDQTTSLNRKPSGCIEWGFGSSGCPAEESNGFIGDVFSNFGESQKDYQDEIERYKIIKDLRDHIVSGSGVLQEAM